MGSSSENTENGELGNQGEHWQSRPRLRKWTRSDVFQLVVAIGKAIHSKEGKGEAEWVSSFAEVVETGMGKGECPW